MDNRGEVSVATEIRSFPTDWTNKTESVDLVNRRWVSKKAFEIQLTRPASFEFKAGQTIQFVHGDIKRYYSIVSSPDEPTLTLCIRHIKEGAFSPILASAEIGTRFNLTGPHGYFTFIPSRRPPVFVATGTGIAPFASMARAGVKNFTLLHGVTYPEDLYYRSFFSKINASYIPCISAAIAAYQQSPNLFQGKVTEYIRRILKRGEYDFYLCGGEEMTRDVTMLVDECFPESLVYIEVFF
jgi:ferredoxin-NADP reductase